MLPVGGESAAALPATLRASLDTLDFAVCRGAAIRLDIHNSEIPVLCRACEARHRGICGALEPAQLGRLDRRTGRREVEAGTELIAAGRSIETCANILSGVVKLVKLMSDGRQQIVGLQFAPDFLSLIHI